MRFTAAAGLTWVGVQFALVACSGVPARVGSAANQVGSMSVPPVSSAAFPIVKAGLWQRTTAPGADVPGFSSSERICLDAATLRTTFRRMADDPSCNVKISGRAGGPIALSLNCDGGKNGKMKMTGFMKGNFNSSYIEKCAVTMTGSETPGVNGTHKTVRTAIWIGPCAPGQKVGDVVFSNGAKQNMLNGERGPVPN